MRKMLLAISLLLSLSACSHVNVTNETCKVTGKESVNTSESHQYRVYTNCGVYIIEDQLTRFHFNSADVYSRIEVGKTYQIESSGYRVGFLSMFKAINKIKADN